MVAQHGSETVLLNMWASHGATAIGVGESDAAVQTS